MPVARPFAVALLLALVIAARAEDPAAKQGFDPQFAPGPAQDLLVRCPFAHGYLYGYDEGYHQADLDFQLGRGRRDFHDNKRYRAAVPESFKPAKSDSGPFRIGYRSGYAAGYFDSIAGRPFRAFGEVNLAAAAPFADAPADQFTASFMLGYDHGLARGRYSGAVEVDYTLPDPPCSGSGLDCDAYARGFAMGFPDGYLQASDVPPTERELRAMKANAVQTASSEGAR